MEVRSFIPCLIKRDVELWLQPAGGESVGRGVGLCSVEQVAVEANMLPEYSCVSKTAILPYLEELGYVQHRDIPPTRVTRQQNPNLHFIYYAYNC